MNTSTYVTHEDNTIELTLTIPWAEMQKVSEEVMTDFVKEAELPGFRKGKAPRKMVEEKVDKTKLYEETVKRILPKIYSDAVKEHKLEPILLPHIELTKAEEGSDWMVSAKTCQKPVLTLGDYKTAIKDLKASKTKKIYLPGEEKQAADPQKMKPTMDEIVAAVLKETKATLPGVLVEHEVTQQLSQMVDQVRKLGLTIDQYLSSTNKTAETLRKEVTEQVERTLTIEFALEELADKETIQVTDADIETILKTAKTPEERETMEKQRYYLSSVLRRQKTLDFLANL